MHQLQSVENEVNVIGASMMHQFVNVERYPDKYEKEL